MDCKRENKTSISYRYDDIPRKSKQSIYKLLELINEFIKSLTPRLKYKKYMYFYTQAKEKLEQNIILNMIKKQQQLINQMIRNTYIQKTTKSH